MDHLTTGASEERDGHPSAENADLDRLARKIERQDVHFLADGDWLSDADSELICRVLREASGVSDDRSAADEQSAAR